MSAVALQRDGRQAYKRGEFAEALAYFDRAVDRGDPTPQLLDNLAATHDKLNDQPAALRAAKKAIQLGRDDPTGYLRAGLILKKMGKHSVALEIYAYGLKSIKHVGQGYEALKKAHDVLLQDLAPKNSIDPLTVLPRELAISVLEYLRFRERTVICRVSKGWRDFIRSEPSLWQHLDLTGAKYKVRNRFVSMAINASRSKLAAATLNRLWEFDKALSAIVQTCPLEKLSLTETGLQGQVFADTVKQARHLKELRILQGTEIRETTLMEIANALRLQLEVLHCVHVNRLDFRARWKLDFPKLRTLNITTSALYGVEGACHELSKHAPELRSLTIWEDGRPDSIVPPSHMDMSNFTKLETVEFRLGFHSSIQLRLPASVRILRLATSLGGNLASTFFFHPEVSYINPNRLALFDLPHLEELNLDMPGLHFSEVASEFAAAFRPADPTSTRADLKSLTMNQPAVHLTTLVFGPRLRKLEHLALRHTHGIADREAESIASQLPLLRTLDLCGTAITGVAIRAIVEAGSVKHLIVNDCPNVGRDAVEWARAQGVKVDFRMTTNEKGGKKVKYAN